uniref:Transcriptional regulator, TetR family n=1 Tax=Rheinheimera sp. BAL341 TaxID=1708203 RepID=A0A486XWQ1_9GAMM
MIKNLQANGKVSSSFSAEQITHYLFAYVDGLSCHIATEDIEYSGKQLRQLAQVLLNP